MASQQSMASNLEDGFKDPRADWLSGLCAEWDNCSAVRARLREKYNLFVHYCPKLKMMTNCKVEKTAANVRANASSLRPVLKLVAQHGLPPIDDLSCQVLQLLVLHCFPNAEGIFHTQAWAIRDLIQVVKKNANTIAWRKDGVLKKSKYKRLPYTIYE